MKGCRKSVGRVLCNKPGYNSKRSEENDQKKKERAGSPISSFFLGNQICLIHPRHRSSGRLFDSLVCRKKIRIPYGGYPIFVSLVFLPFASSRPFTHSPQPPHHLTPPPHSPPSPHPPFQLLSPSARSPLTPIVTLLHTNTPPHPP